MLRHAQLGGGGFCREPSQGQPCQHTSGARSLELELSERWNLGGLSEPLSTNRLMSQILLPSSDLLSFSHS